MKSVAAQNLEMHLTSGCEDEKQENCGYPLEMLTDILALPGSVLNSFGMLRPVGVKAQGAFSA